MTSRIEMEKVTQFFERLAERVERDWKAAELDKAAFPEIAARALHASRPSEHITAMEVVEWVHRTDELPTQMDIAARFGEPPVTVVQGQGFVIDVYYWLNGDTDIHQHAFCGAFTVLQGSSLQGIYTFDKGRVLHPLLVEGKLSLDSLQILKAGEVQPITAGERFIHSVLHLEHPTVTLLIRAEVPESCPQLSYRMPGIAYMPLDVCDHHLRRRVQLVRMMDLVDPDRMQAQVRAGLRDADPIAFTHLLFESRPLFQKDWQGFADILNDVYPAQTEVLDALLPALRDVKRVNRITNVKLAVQDPELRYLVSLLFLCTNRRRFLEAMRQRFPDEEPLERTCALLSRLSATLGKDLGFVMTPAASDALRALFAGRRETELATAPGLAAPPEQISSAYRELRTSDLLSALFADVC